MAPLFLYRTIAHSRTDPSKIYKNFRQPYTRLNSFKIFCKQRFFMYKRHLFFMSLVSTIFSLKSFNPFPIVLAQEAKKRSIAQYRPNIHWRKTSITNKIYDQEELHYTDLCWTICSLDLGTDREFIEFVYNHSNPKNFFEPIMGFSLPCLNLKKHQAPLFPFLNYNFF